VQILRYEYGDDGIRLAVVVCPYCQVEHRHCWPTDVIPNALGRRTPRCSGRYPDYSIQETTP